MNAVELEEDFDSEVVDRERKSQYLTFIMADEEYGVDILTVQEIMQWDSATPIPKAPPHVRGVINIRGTIVPIIDLRQVFGMSASEYGPLTVILVLEIETETSRREVGIVVDEVSDTADLDKSQIKPAPDMGDKIDTRYITGLATIDERMVILLNMSTLLAQEDFTAVAEATKAVREATNSTPGQESE